MIKMDQAFPLRFCILQAIKNWTVGRSRNETRYGKHCLQKCQPGQNKFKQIMQLKSTNLYTCCYGNIICIHVVMVTIDIHVAMPVTYYIKLYIVGINMRGCGSRFLLEKRRKCGQADLLLDQHHHTQYLQGGHYIGVYTMLHCMVCDHVTLPYITVQLIM